MAIQKTPLETGKFYHIYNRGINSCNLFYENGNYEYFISLYDKYISPIANTYAWVLMRNHYHFLVEILLEEAWDKLPNSETYDELRNEKALQKMEPEKRVYQQFSNLFNAYTKAINKRYDRTGSLFEHPFRRKLIDNIYYLKRAIVYIHQNPVNHGFCEHPSEYPWSSYLSCISLKPTKLNREKVIAFFGDVDAFKIVHNNKLYTASIEDWVDL